MTAAVLAGSCACKVTRSTGKEMQVVDREWNIAVTRQLDRLTGILRFQFGQFWGVGLYQCCQFLECCRTRSMRQTGPASIIESLPCRGNSTFHVFKRTLRNARDWLTRSRADIVNGLPRTAIDEFAINEQFVLGHSGFSFRKGEIVGHRSNRYLQESLPGFDFRIKMTN